MWVDFCVVNFPFSFFFRASFGFICFVVCFLFGWHDYVLLEYLCERYLLIDWISSSFLFLYQLPGNCSVIAY